MIHDALPSPQARGKELEVWSSWTCSFEAGRKRRDQGKVRALGWKEGMMGKKKGGRGR